VSKKRKVLNRRAPGCDFQNKRYYSEYIITSEPIREKWYRQLPPQVHEAIERLHELSQTQPRQAIPELEDWLKRYPEVPLFYNYLSVAYSQTGQARKAEQTIRENYRRHPDYLFARLNYAEICMLHGDYATVAEIIEHKFDLQLLYPHRTSFHITEFTGFMWVVGQYQLQTGHRKEAELVLDALRKAAPEAEATRRLYAELHPNLVQRILRKVLRLGHRGENPSVV
jgi:tetratricopeptide (TPR) repeat protein